MDPDRFNVQRIAALAYLAPAPEEMQGLARDFARILEMIDRLETVATEAVEPLCHPLEPELRLRQDRVSEHPDREALQAIAPDTDAGCYRVPRFVE